VLVLEPDPCNNRKEGHGNITLVVYLQYNEVENRGISCWTLAELLWGPRTAKSSGSKVGTI